MPFFLLIVVIYGEVSWLQDRKCIQLETEARVTRAHYLVTRNFILMSNMARETKGGPGLDLIRRIKTVLYIVVVGLSWVGMAHQVVCCTTVAGLAADTISQLKTAALFVATNVITVTIEANVSFMGI